MGIFHALCRSAIVVWIWSGFSALGTVYHSDGSAASVQGLHNQLLNGDTITLPAGTFTWTTGVNFTKAINVVGAGIGRTTINDNVPKNGTQASVLWRFDVAKGKSIDISGFTVHGQAQDTQGWQLGTLAIRGSSHAVRVHNIQMVSPGTLGILFTGALWGVVDHSDFRCANGKIAIYVQHNNWPGQVGHSETEVGMIRLSLEAVKASTSRTVLLPGTVEAVARVLTDIQVAGLCSVITPLRTIMLAGTAPKATATRERALSRFIKIRFLQMFLWHGAFSFVAEQVLYGGTQCTEQAARPDTSILSRC